MSTIPASPCPRRAARCAATPKSFRGGRSIRERSSSGRPGDIYKLVIDAGVTSNVFRKGHRIRVEISSSNFPRFDRNPNTGRPIADEKELRTAQQTIYHDTLHPSYLLLPVIQSELR